MARERLSERIKQGVLVIDGAMGTELIAGGAAPGSCNDHLNIESPDIVTAVHNSYLAAGCNAVITNTFGANKYILARHGYGDKVAEINLAAGRLGRAAAGEDRYVLGDIGPCGDFLEPIGPVKADELKAAFAEQAGALAEAGVDGFIVETMTAVEEVVVAIEAVKSVSDLPIFVSFAYDPAGEQFRTMMGVGPEQAVEKLAGLGIAAIGFNCGTLDMDGYVKLAKEYAAAIGDKPIILMAEPNAGRPELIEGQTKYNLSPDDYAASAEKIRNAGVRILGGCCGTTPGHIEAMAKVVKAG